MLMSYRKLQIQSNKSCDDITNITHTPYKL